MDGKNLRKLKLFFLGQEKRGNSKIHENQRISKCYFILKLSARKLAHFMICNVYVNLGEKCTRMHHRSPMASTTLISPPSDLTHLCTHYTVGFRQSTDLKMCPGKDAVLISHHGC